MLGLVCRSMFAEYTMLHRALIVEAKLTEVVSDGWGVNDGAFGYLKIPLLVICLIDTRHALGLPLLQLR